MQYERSSEAPVHEHLKYFSIICPWTWLENYVVDIGVGPHNRKAKEGDWEKEREKKVEEKTFKSSKKD